MIEITKRRIWIVATCDNCTTQRVQAICRDDAEAVEVLRDEGWSVTPKGKCVCKSCHDAAG